jgi:hypothetical protein
MIERLFLPDRPGNVQKFVDAVSRGTFHALENVDQRKWPALRITPRRQQYVNVIGHHHGRIESNPLLVFAPAVRQHQISGRRGQRRQPCGAERDKQITVCTLQVRKPPTIPVLRK